MSTRKMNYNKLWKLLIDKGMYRKDLKRLSGVSTTVLAKMSKGENVTTEVLLKICNALDCNITDIVDTVVVEENETGKLPLNSVSNPQEDYLNG
ncbi:hypothetical protein FACS1894216_16990 [Synergistales bacterium]|nr:hypothetical protein FACS1894216_16990 [Synergistales bacterium]